MKKARKERSNYAKKRQKAYYQAYHKAHREERIARAKAWREAHKEEYNARDRAYQEADTNSLGQTKLSIRKKSHYYLFNVLKHAKLNGYEIHHCFSYEDYRNFIYIPKSLHLQIHQFLRDNEIDADTVHYNQIVHLINAWNGYTYIKV
jgi:hypothetical protein